MAEIGIVQQVDIDQELQEAYLDYAMSVIVSRALPDARDGLKPVHRRILYAMYDMGLRPDRPFKKSARIVGEVLGKYHPHGDSAVYDSMVRMAQDFSMRYPLVEGQGNFGSVDGDNAAAMRYTEARLAAPALEMLADIGKETVDFAANFDGTLREPVVLPAMLPNLLVNGADGIAVGMSTKIPPHNVGEICDAIAYLIDNWKTLDDIGVEQLLRHVQGPDFPTGGIIYRYRDDKKGGDRSDTILNAYATGRGRIVVQAKTHVEEMSRNRSRIVITELPFQTNKANLIERIADLVRDGKVDGITDLRDESDRRGMRVVIELTRNVTPTDVLATLFKLTPLRQTFGVIMLALVDGQPRMLSLKRALLHFIEHRREVIRRRSEYDLARARDRAHILQGLRKALDNLDEVIAIIRKSQRVDTARTNLRRAFKLSERQAQAILDMQLRRLAALERRKIEEEYKATRKLIRELETLLGDPGKILGVIKQEMAEIRSRYSDPRRTTIITDAEYTGSVVQAEQLIPDGDVLLTVSRRGEIQRIMNLARRPRTGRAYQRIDTVNNRHELVAIGASGRAWRIPIHQLPEKTGRSNGEALPSLLSGWDKGEPVAALLDLPTDAEALEGRYLNAVTRGGRVVRVAATEARNLHSGTPLVNVDKHDEVIWAGLSSGEDEIVLVSAKGQAIRFAEKEVRPTGIGVQGVWGIKLDGKDDVVAGAGLSRDGDALVVVSENGLGKRTALADYPIQGRYGKGVRAMNLDATTGRLVAAAVVAPDDRLSLQFGRVSHGVDLVARHLPEASRYSQGRVVAEGADVAPVERLLRWRPESAWNGFEDGMKPASTEDTSPRKKRSRKRGAATDTKQGRTRSTKSRSTKSSSSSKTSKSSRSTKSSSSKSRERGTAGTARKKKSQKQLAMDLESGAEKSGSKRKKRSGSTRNSRKRS